MTLIEEIVLGKENLEGFIEIAHSCRIVLLLMHQQSHLIAGDT